MGGVDGVIEVLVGGGSGEKLGELKKNEGRESI